MDYNITYRQKDKGWQFIISKKVNNRWKQVKSKQGFKSKKDAKQFAERVSDELQQNDDLNIESGLETITIGELKSEYLSHIQIHREFNTYINYEQSLQVFAIDNIQLVKLKVVNVQKCIDKLSNKVSLNTLQRRVTIFKCMLNFANRQYNLPIPNLSALTLPSTKAKIEKKALSQKEQSELLSFYKTRGTDYYIVTLLSLTCGLRVGEILGLTWSDIDFKNSVVDINKQWKRHKITKEYSFGDLKSKNSYRKVPIPLTTLNELKRLKLDFETNKIVAINLSETRLINSTSTYSMSANLGRPLQRKYNISIHELRHTYATNLISNGIDFKTAAQLLGHDIEQTMKTYSHVTDDMLKRASDLISKIF